MALQLAGLVLGFLGPILAALLPAFVGRRDDERTRRELDELHRALDARADRVYGRGDGAGDDGRVAPGADGA